MSWLMWIMLTPLLTMALVWLLERWPNLREAASLAGGLSLFMLCLWGWRHELHLSNETLILAEPLPGLTLSLALEPVGLMFALMASSLWLVTTCYAIGYMRAHHEKQQTRFYSCFALAIASLMGLILAADLLTLFLFYELLTLSTYPLVTHSGDEQAKASGRRYLGLLMGTSISLLLPAILLVWYLSGSVSFVAGGLLADRLSPFWTGMLYLMFLLGIGKAALMPLHAWLPAAMVAPTPVSALLHAVAVVKAGVFSILKISLFIFGPVQLQQVLVQEWLIWLPALTILLASFVAISKDNLKERLAYSTISQLSYIVLGVMLANQLGMLGASLHILMHGFAKISLFFAAGAILVTTHKTRVSELAGMGRRMPFTFVVFTLGSLSIIGLPLFGGMWSKWYLALGSIEARHWLLLAILMVSSLLNIYYLLIIPVQAFFSQSSQRSTVREAPWPCLLGMAAPSAICLLLFWMPEPFIRLIQSGLNLAFANTGG